MTANSGLKQSHKTMASSNPGVSHRGGWNVGIWFKATMNTEAKSTQMSEPQGLKPWSQTATRWQQAIDLEKSHMQFCVGIPASDLELLL